jgi:hypothetical protein
MKPERIQQRRSRGWRKPEGAVSVARPGRWGNPFRPARPGDVEAHAAAVESFRLYLQGRPDLVAAARVELRGRPLMCWCGPTLPCHADVWLDVANEVPAS